METPDSCFEPARMGTGAGKPARVFGSALPLTALCMFALTSWGSAKPPQEISEHVEALFAALNGNQDLACIRAQRTLGEMTDPRIAERLIAIVKDTRAGSTLRCAAAYTLCESQDSRAAEALVTALQDQDWKLVHCTGRAMAKEWKSLDEAQRMRWRFTSALFKAIQSGKDGGKARSIVLSGAYVFFIEKGIPLTEYLLYDALQRHGDLRMAVDFLNAGNLVLKNAGLRWIRDHAPNVIIRESSDSQSSGRVRVRWGSNYAGEIVRP
jgi:hypothetical protein